MVYLLLLPKLKMSAPVQSDPIVGNIVGPSRASPVHGQHFHYLMTDGTLHLFNFSPEFLYQVEKDETTFTCSFHRQGNICVCKSRSKNIPLYPTWVGRCSAKDNWYAKDKLPKFHIDCMVTNLTKNHSIGPLLVCSAKCLRTINKISLKTPALEPGPVGIFWHNDGPTEHVSSLSILLDWLTTEGNFSKYRGGGDPNDKSCTSGSKNKGDYHEEISKLMLSKGVIRSPHAIKGKIPELVKCYLTAKKWMMNTGQGIIEEDLLN